MKLFALALCTTAALALSSCTSEATTEPAAGGNASKAMDDASKAMDDASKGAGGTAKKDEPKAAGKSPTGTWDLDTKAVTEAAKAEIEKQMESVPEAQRAMMQGMMQGMLGMVENMKMSVTLAEDGTFTGEATGMPGMDKPQTVKGTWKLAGDALTMISTHENGEEKSETQNGKFTGDEIQIIDSNPDGSDMTLVLKRRS